MFFHLKILNSFQHWSKYDVIYSQPVMRKKTVSVVDEKQALASSKPVVFIYILPFATIVTI
jgi:hypothetical protein